MINAPQEKGAAVFCGTRPPRTRPRAALHWGCFRSPMQLARNPASRPYSPDPTWPPSCAPPGKGAMTVKLIRPSWAATPNSQDSFVLDKCGARGAARAAWQSARVF